MSGAYEEAADLLKDQSRWDRAVHLRQRILSLEEKNHGPDYPMVAGALSDLGFTYYRLGSYYARRNVQLGQSYYTKAEPLYERALAIMEKNFVGHPILAEYLGHLAEVYGVQGKYADAESLFIRALAAWEGRTGHQAHKASLREAYANLLSQTGREKEAEVMRAQARHLREEARHLRAGER